MYIIFHSFDNHFVQHDDCVNNMHIYSIPLILMFSPFDMDGKLR